MNGVSASSDLRAVFRKSSACQRSRKRPAPFSLRLNADERARLEREAGETALAAYIKFRLFNGSAGDSAKRPPSEIRLLAKLLAALGEARLANNLNQLARWANMGTLEDSEETEKALRAACEDVRAMRADLVAALGLKGSDSA